MAGLGGEATGKQLGGFFKDDTIKHWTNEELHNVQEQQALEFVGLKQKADEAAKAYAAAVAKGSGEIEALNRDTQGRLTGLADTFTGLDPVATYERIRGGNIASLADQFTKMATLGQEGDKARLAGLGYGGRGPSSYESILRSDRISRNIAPVLGQIYSNLGGDTAGLNQNRLANLGATLNLLQARGGLVDATAARALLPYRAEAALFGDRINMGGNLASATGANFQGFETKKNPWKNFFEEGGKAVDDVADTALQVADLAVQAYTGGMLGGGGGLGGIGGGGGGGGGRRQQAPPPPPDTRYGMQPIQNMGQYNPYAQFYY